MKSWKGQELSAAGKEVLIKSVIQSIPNYAMGCFLLPKKVCQDLERLVRQFWWGGDNSKRKIHWVAWEKLKRAKDEGGIGFRDFQDYNVALLAKQTWRLLRDPNCLMGRVLKAKYFRQSSIMDYVLKPTSQASYVFRSILAGRDLIKSGLFWKVGTGESIRVFSDAWLPRYSSFRPITVCPMGMENLRVSELLDENGNWDVPKIEQLFLPVDRDIIYALVPRPDRLDEFSWNGSDNGLYTVASGYRSQLIRSKGNPSSSNGNINKRWLQKLWKLKIPKKWVYPVWRLWNNSLHVASQLPIRGIQAPLTCLFCGKFDEDEDHRFIYCEFTRQVWREALGNEDNIPLAGTMRDWIFHSLSSKPNEWCELFVAIVWALWRSRNDLYFNQKVSSAALVARSARDYLTWYKEATFLNLLGDEVNQFTRQEKWKPPPSGSVKVNTDASWIENGIATGLGAVIRDAEGTFIAARHSRIIRQRSALVAELAAVEGGLRMALELSLYRVVLELDCCNALKLLMSEISASKVHSVALAEVRDLLENIAGLLQHFSSIQFSLVARDGNGFANEAAKKGVVEEDMSYFSVIPTWAKDVSQFDLQGFTPLFE